MPEKTKKELLQELQELKQENEALKASDATTTAAHRESMEKMRAFEWMLKQKHTAKQSYVPDYGDLSLLNEDGLIKKSINKDQLQDIVSEYLDLLETSTAIYEKNGDYALGIFSSGWCQLMDAASRELCRTNDNREAMNSGKWLCHDSCWKDASTKAMTEQKPADIACSGGIRLYAVPVMANNEVVGAINFGYGSPPKEEARLKKLSEKYNIPLKDLLEQSKAYNDRPKFVIDYAKNRLQKAANLIGYLVERKIAGDKHKEIEQNFRITVDSIGDAVITVDIKGNITLMNPVAERLCGHKMEQVLGKRLSQVFYIINTHTGKKIDNPVKEVMETDKVVELAKFTKLIANDGNEYQIADSASPIKDKQGNTSGVVLVFRDVTTDYLLREELKSSEERHRAVFENTGTATCLLEKDGTISLANKKFSELAGYPLEEIQHKKTWMEFVAPDDLERMQEQHALRRKNREQALREYEFKFIRADKAVRHIHLSIDVIASTDQSVASLSDVTEKKVSEQRLQESEKRFQRMLSLIPDMISIHDPDMNIVYSNWNGFAAVEKDKRKLHTKCYKTYRGLDEICPDCHAKEVFTTKKTYQSEVGLPDGSWVDLRVIPILDKDGEIELFVEWVRDITEEKETEKTKQVLYQVANDILYNFELSDLIKAIEKQLSKLVDTTNFYVALYDSKNGMFSAPFEKDQKDNIETWEAKGSATGLVIDRKQSVLLKKQDVWRLIESGEIAQTGTMCESWLGVPILSGDAISGVIVIQSYENKEAFNDNTIKIVEYVSNQISLALERTRIFEDLLHAKNKAEESDRLKSAFLANMSHEIRTPMNGIMGFAELLENPQLSHDQQQDYIGIIKKSGVRMLNIINNIVDVARIEAGIMDIDLVESNINEQLEYIYSFFKPQVEAKGLQLNLITTLPDKRPNTITDREKLIAILTNLVKNALKYTNKGSIDFGCTKKGSHLEFFVRDSGIGIPKDRQQAVFERFVQADIEDKEAYQGAGLGLSISSAYVGMLGGQIWVESVEGKGSTFYFTIPYHGETEETSLEETFEPEQSETVATKTLKILIVEDDKMSAKLISAYVQAHGKEILFAENGSDALETCKQHPDIDLILMDIKMPDMEGDEVTRHIRRFNKDVVIIAQTAKALTGDRAKAMEAGFDDYITKPINRAVLLKSIEKIV